MRALSAQELVRVKTQDPAAPAGGALKRGRGCAFGIAASLIVWPLTSDAQSAVSVPSGIELTFIEVVQDRSAYGLTMQFRFLAPAIANGALEFDVVAQDMEHLCNVFAVPRISNLGPKPSQIIIALMGEDTAYGTANPDVTQYFEAYSLEDGLCIWEVF